MYQIDYPLRWQLNILKNEAEDTTIDTITEVMTRNHMKDEGWQCDMCNKVRIFMGIEFCFKKVRSEITTY